MPDTSKKRPGGAVEVELPVPLLKEPAQRRRNRPAVQDDVSETLEVGGVTVTLDRTERGDGMHLARLDPLDDAFPPLGVAPLLAQLMLAARGIVRRRHEAARRVDQSR